MSRLNELIQQYCPDGVEYKEVQEVAKTTSPKGKLKSNDYLKEGKYPVIDQGQSFIGGYTNEEIAFSEGEYVIFGDHTCVVKYVNFAFVQGADGVKVITANDVILPRFLYYCMSNIYASRLCKTLVKNEGRENPCPTASSSGGDSEDIR